jgi:lipoprotein-anchoring transpeptidase ErfK/SrfK
MTRTKLLAWIACASFLTLNSAVAEPLSLSPVEPREPLLDANASVDAAPRIRLASNSRGAMGGGFIEFLFSGGHEIAPAHAPEQSNASYRQDDDGVEPARPEMDQKFRRQIVDYDGPEKSGTVVIDTPRKFLFLVQGNGKAVRYGIGVGRPGFTWSGVKQISMKREWPDWIPPKEMLKRRPDLPRHMEGGPQNPLGARAMYLGSSLYRIHGSNEPWTIGTAVSSGCIRMRNEDVVDLYERVRVGTRVVVI